MRTFEMLGLGVVLGLAVTTSAFADNIVRMQAPIASVTKNEPEGPPKYESCLSIKTKQPSSESGVYTLTLTGTEISTYCDMATDGGGWTLIGRAASDRVGAWATTSGLYNWPVSPNPGLAATFKMSDGEINAIPKRAYKVISTGYPNTRYWKGSCVYRHTDLASGDCTISYSSEAWLASSAKGNGSSVSGLAGIHDRMGNNGFYIYSSSPGYSDYGWGAGNGTSITYSGAGSKGTRINLQMWVR